MQSLKYNWFLWHFLCVSENAETNIFQKTFDMYKELSCARTEKYRFSKVFVMESITSQGGKCLNQTVSMFYFNPMLVSFIFDMKKKRLPCTPCSIHTFYNRFERSVPSLCRRSRYFVDLGGRTITSSPAWQRITEIEPMPWYRSLYTYANIHFIENVCFYHLDLTFGVSPLTWKIPHSMHFSLENLTYDSGNIIT